jgi:pyruvate/2-oxoglutarate dehydrogenase complex dihydrolipoamide acyltransferase (E2) component
MDGEDAIVIRQMMYVTLSYDHRVIDGVIENSFLPARELLEEAPSACR